MDSYRTCCQLATVQTAIDTDAGSRRAVRALRSISRSYPGTALAQQLDQFFSTRLFWWKSSVMRESASWVSTTASVTVEVALTVEEFTARVKSYLAAEVPPSPRGGTPQQLKMNSG